MMLYVPEFFLSIAKCFLFVLSPPTNKQYNEYKNVRLYILYIYLKIYIVHIFSICYAQRLRSWYETMDNAWMHAYVYIPEKYGTLHYLDETKLFTQDVLFSFIQTMNYA